jgi:photosystem II stability/assembly factor-like uncharacterized protein
MQYRLLLILAVFLFSYGNLMAQKKGKNPPPVSNETQVKPADISSLYSGLKWRNIGPFRGGRSLAACGVAEQPMTFYFGATGGGVWKTTDGGVSWYSISDSTFTSSSVGSIAVAPSDPNIIYVGMGEVEMRGNISYGDGVYKSTDAGKTWKHIGLEDSYAIGRIVVHPKDPNLVYVAALGHIFGKNTERGVYRSRDGGTNWERVLYKNDETGANEITFDPTNPSIMYAALWQARRGPHYLSSGGDGCGMYKSLDGGTTWFSISQKPGLPVGLLGKMEVAVSPANGNRIWAMIENKNGGIFRSDDGGESWSQINTDKNLWQRPWYFSEIVADPKDVNTLYVLNVGFWRSSDGGKNFSSLNIEHGDCHDLWINPENPDILLLADDGGASVSYNRGSAWSELDIPTAQFYHVSVDNDFPYNIYGCQQDNSSIRIKSRTPDGSIGSRDWESSAGGESGYIVADPENSNVTYGGNYMGYLSKYDRITGQNQDVSVYPVGPLGAGAVEMKYRFQWTYPIVFSPHDPNTLYVTSQYVHRSTDEGMSWEIISPVLTRNEITTLISSGGPITKDNTGAETYSTIFTFAESPVKAGVLWTGSDDGWVHVSTDAGKNWTKCTLPGLGDWALINMIDPSDFDAGTAYVSATRYKSDDRTPYIYKTNDYGKSWSLITKGITDKDYIRCVREDPNRKGLLYAGSETGIYISFDEGEQWFSLKLNLPLTPVHDIAVQASQKDLVIATHGRSFWVLDNMEPIYQLNEKIAAEKAHLFAPEIHYRMPGYSYYSPTMQSGQNAPHGVLVNYYLKDTTSKELQLKFFTEKGDSIISYSSSKNKNGEPLTINKDFYQKEKIERSGYLSANKGGNMFLWDMRYPDAKEIEGGAIMWSGSNAGPQAPPGRYYVEMFLGETFVGRQPFEIKKDPRLQQVTNADLEASFRFQWQVRNHLDSLNKNVNRIRTARKQVNDYLATVKDTVFKKQVEVLTKPFLDTLKSIENNLVQADAKAFQDLLALPIKLNDKLAGLGSAAGSADTRPTKQTYEAFNDITGLIAIEYLRLEQALKKQLPLINQLAATQPADIIRIE